MTTTMRAVLVAAALLAAAPLTAQSAADAPLPSVELPDAIERVLRDYEAAWGAGDADALANLFHPEGFVLSGPGRHVRGRDAIRERYANAGGALLLRAVAWEADGDVGYIIGAFGYEEGRDLGKFVLALKRMDDRWYIMADMDGAI